MKYVPSPGELLAGFFVLALMLVGFWASGCGKPPAEDDRCVLVTELSASDACPDLYLCSAGDRCWFETTGGDRWDCAGCDCEVAEGIARGECQE